MIGSWFNHPEDSTIRDVEELEEIFYVSTSNDNCLLLNIPPATNGEQNPKAIENVMQLARLLGIEGGKEFPKKMNRSQSITTDAKAMASSVHENDTLHHGAAYAVDSDVSTSWTAGDSLAWITVALDREATFDKFFIIEGENSIRKFAIEVEKEDGWIPVYQSDVLPETRLNSFMGYGTIEFSLPEPLSTGRFRMSIQQSNGRPSIYSIRLK